MSNLLGSFYIEKVIKSFYIKKIKTTPSMEIFAFKFSHQPESDLLCFLQSVFD